MPLDTHDRHLLKRITARWPHHLALHCDLAASDSPHARGALRQIGVGVTHAEASGWSGRDLMRLAKWAEGS